MGCGCSQETAFCSQANLENTEGINLGWFARNNIFYPALYIVYQESVYLGKAYIEIAYIQSDVT